MDRLTGEYSRLVNSPKSDSRGATRKKIEGYVTTSNQIINYIKQKQGKIKERPTKSYK